MTSVIDRKLGSDRVPVHVLIVMVGDYLAKPDRLTGAGVFAQAVVDFWRALPAKAFPSPQSLKSIEVLASDQSGAVAITGDAGAQAVGRPDYDSVRAALLDWARRVRDDNGVGFLHWIGHGAEQVRGGNVVSLSCDGSRPDGRGQAGLDWTKSLHVINAMTAGRPVYCFIDACRSPADSDLEFEGIGPVDWSAPDNAAVFMSAARGTETFWIVNPKPAARMAGCEAHALGTRAFMAGLKAFGARQTEGPEMPIVAAELVEASQALVARWARHQKISPGEPEGPLGRRTRWILLTEEPMSIVDVHAKGVGSPTHCEAAQDTAPAAAPPTRSETGAAPFEFRLARKPHKFRFNRPDWDPAQQLLHPHMELYN